MRKSISDYLREAEANSWRLPGTLSWSIVRKVVFLRDKNLCVKCGNGDHLHAHHERYPDYDLDSIVTLCSKCHSTLPKTRDKDVELSLREFDRVMRLRQPKKLKSGNLSLIEEENTRIMEKW